MSASVTLFKSYNSFFSRTAKFAFSPYFQTLCAYMDDKSAQGDEKFVKGLTACVFFTTVVPILPILTSITCALAGLAASLAVVSMFVTVPAALLMDICTNDHASLELS